jgi:hypothetical protein
MRPVFCHFRQSVRVPALRLLVSCIWLGLILLASLQILDLQAQGQFYQGASSSTAPTGNATLRGTVLNSATGEPIAHALVQVFVGPVPGMLTDAAGHFEFTDLPQGRTTVIARKPGFFNEQEIARGQMPPAMLEVGANADPLVITLTPESVIFGKVEADGEPVEGMPVKVMVLRISNGRKHWEQRGGARTDEEGGYRLANLPPGSYFVVAGPSWDFRAARADTPKQRGVGYSTVFYPSASELEAATALEIAPGQPASADFSVKPASAFQVSGVVAGIPPGQSVNIFFASESGGGFPFPTRFDQATGKFQATVPGGSYVLRAQSVGKDGNQLNLSAAQRLTVDSDLAGIRMVLGLAISIPVMVRTESVNPTSAPRILPGSRWPVNFTLNPTVILFGGQSYVAIPERNSQNPNLTIRDLQPGKYTAEISPFGNWYVASAQCGGTDLLRDELTVTEGVSVPPIEIVLRDDSASLGATVSSGDPVAPASVLLVPDRQPRRARLVFAYPGNEVQFGGLAPGEYDVLAFDHVEGLEYTNPDVLSPYLSKASHVTLTANGKSEIALDLIKWEK